MRRTLVLAWIILLALAGAGGCGEGSTSGRKLDVPSGSTTSGTSTTTGTTGGGSTGTGGPGPIVLDDSGTGPMNPGGCVNLQCQQRMCPAGTTTSVSGTVYAPNGTLPLYNVIVYVPNAKLDPFPPGIACDRCGSVASGKPIASALSDAHGAFKVTNVPVGTNIPLVLQVGKWRRQIVVPEVKACLDTPITDRDQTRLPKNRKEGDMPKVALTTGSCDNLSCLLPTLGVDPAEFGVAGEDKAIIHFKSSGLGGGGIAGLGDASSHGPPNMTPVSAIWGNFDELKKYDMAVFSCECDEPQASEVPAGSSDAVTRYLAAGGRLFGTDFQYYWYNHATDPKLQSAMSLTPGNRTAAQEPVGLDTTFPKGKALADWLQFVDPGAPYAQVKASVVFDHITAVSSAAQVWGRSSSRARIVTTNTPVGLAAEQQCGRGVHLDLHVTQTSPVDTSPFTFPQSCPATLNSGEQALAFFFFDLSSCIQSDTTPPVPPPPPPPK